MGNQFENSNFKQVVSGSNILKTQEENGTEGDRFKSRTTSSSPEDLLDLVDPLFHLSKYLTVVNVRFS